MPVVTPHVSGIIVEATVCKIIPSLITKSEIDQIVISHLKNYKDGFIKNKIQYLDKASGQRIVFEYKSFNLWG